MAPEHDGGRDGRRVPVSAVFLSKLRPPVSAHLLRRPRLLELLDDALEARLVVVSAPAGSGKTSLLASWAASSDRLVGWLSLDESDRDQVRLWTGLLAAIDGIVPDVTSAARAILSQRGPIDEAMAALLVDLESAEVDDAVLVIDDVHILDDLPLAIGGLAVFAQYLPPWLHLVFSSRRRLRLPLDRLRAQGRLREVTFQELQFSADEAAQIVARLVPGIATEDIGPTTARAAGWAASLQLSGLAARSARARSEPRFSPRAGDQLTEDYLWHEVLADEPADVIAILSASSLVERIDGSLARAITGRDDASALLERAEERGLFLTRLTQPGWFALHGLVRELVQRELAARDPALLSEMHARAARWYEDRDEASLAVTHWLRADQPRRALRTVAENNGLLYDQGRESVVVQAVSQLHPGIGSLDISLAIDFAWAHLLVDRQVLIDTVDRIRDMSAGQDLDNRTVARTFVLESVAALSRGEWLQAGDFARQAVAEFGADAMGDYLGRFTWNLVAREVALCEKWADDHPTVQQVVRTLRVDPQRSLALQGTRALGLALSGRPTDALRVVSAVQGDSPVSDMSILSLELRLASAISHREVGERDIAISELIALHHRPLTPLPYVPFRAGLELAECYAAVGQLEAAETALTRARWLGTQQFSGAGSRCWADTTETVVALAGGDLVRAAAAARRIEDPVWRAISTSRVQLAKGDRPRVLRRLDVGPASVRQQVVVDLLRSRAEPDQDASLASLRRAVTSAAEHGLLQTVAAEGSEVVDQLERVADAVPSGWLDRARRAAVLAPVNGERLPAGAQALTERERDVLRMLPSRLTVGEIADELHLSTNTVKFHLKVIYRKLNCTSRAEAATVARAMTGVGSTGRGSGAAG